MVETQGLRVWAMVRVSGIRAISLGYFRIFAIIMAIVIIVIVIVTLNCKPSY